MQLADYSLGDALLTMLAFFLFVMYIWIFIACVADLFRDHEESGWGKAAWCLFFIIAPLFGVLIYLIVRGQGMRDRSIAEQVEAKKQMDSYIQQTAGASPADELKKLSDLKAAGTISDAEFESMKAKLVS